jgi:hypothetical protein
MRAAARDVRRPMQLSGVFPELRRSAARTLALVLLTCLFAVPGAGAAGAAGTTLPLGNWEVLSASGSTVSVAGWALDPDAPTAPVPVHVYIDGGDAAVSANAGRPDVGAAFPGAGNTHGFSHSRTVSPGVHTVCVYAIDVDNGARNTPLGCRSVAVRATLPVANWEVLSATGGELSVAGWALDPDAPTASIPVHVYVDGVGAAVTANASRPDVGAAFPGAGDAHGFSHTRDVSSGVHNVCVYAIDVDDPSRNTPLGCRSVTVATPPPPIGNFDRAWVAGGAVNVSAWALYPSQPSVVTAIEVSIDGRVVLVTPAVGDRPDVGRAYPGAGDAHGLTATFSVAEFSLSPGVHSVCLWTLVFLPAETLNTPLGCREVAVQMTTPLANWDSLTVSGSNLTVGGWAMDPDAPTAPVSVHVYVDGGGAAVTANGSRPDVGAAFPDAGSAHGFSHTRTVSPGVHNVCVYAIDLDNPSRNTPLGCRSIAVGLALPVGNWEVLATSGSTVSVAGWAMDRDNPTTPVPVHVYVDGGGTALTANGDRPDVGAAFPGAGNAHGFSWTTAVSPGDHSVCVYAIDVDNGARNTPLGCRSVTVASVTPAEAIRAAWTASGGEAGPLGTSLGAAQGGLVRGGHRQLFQNGAIYWTAATGARIVLSGPVRDDWVAWGAEGGQLGYPTGDTVCGLVDAGCRQDFESGAFYSSAATGVHIVTGAILANWRGSAQDGYLGYPTDDAWCGLRDGGCVQYFQNGLIAWTPATGAVGLTDVMAQAWEAEGAEEGALGYPDAPGRIEWGSGRQIGFFQFGRIDAQVDAWTGELTYQVTLY